MIDILLADDHEIFRQGLQMLLSAQPDFRVVAQAANGLEAVNLAVLYSPQVAIVDMLMPGYNGMETTYQIKQRAPACQVIVLSMYDDEGFVLTALKNGASGYVLKDSSTADLVKAVRAVIAGQRFLSPSLAERAFQVYINQPQPQSPESKLPSLTQREWEVLNLSVTGLNSLEIAKRLSISVRTVETHRAHLMHKLDLHSQVELILYAQKHKLI